MTNRQTAKRRADLRRVAAEREASSVNTWLIAGVAVVVALAAIVAIAVTAGGDDETVADPPAASAAQVADLVAGIPTSVSDAVGAGEVIGAPRAVQGTPITKDGKPEVLYVGAEYCPFCAAERWAVVNALARFGTWTDLSLTRSAADDAFPNTPTFTFRGATYTSDVVAFTGVELQGNTRVDGQYPPLDTLTADQQAVFLELSPGGSFPFVDIGGAYVVEGATLDTALFSFRTADQVAAALSDPDDKLSLAVLGAANSITKAICSLTDDQPAAVCSAPGVAAARLD